MRPELILALNSLSDTGYSISSLVEDILRVQIHDLDPQVLRTARDQLERDTVNICTHLYGHPPTSGLITSWALANTQSTLRAEVKELSKKENGLHFHACAATGEQVESSFMPQLAGKIRCFAPSLWRTVYTLLGGLDDRRPYLEADPIDIDLLEVFEESERNLGDLGMDTHANETNGDDSNESGSDGGENQQQPRKKSRKSVPAKNTALRIIVSQF